MLLRKHIRVQVSENDVVLGSFQIPLNLTILETLELYMLLINMTHLVTDEDTQIDPTRN